MKNIAFRKNKNKGGVPLLIRSGDVYMYIYIYIYIIPGEAVEAPEEALVRPVQQRLPVPLGLEQGNCRMTFEAPPEPFI